MPGRDDSIRLTLRTALRTAFDRLVELALDEKVNSVFLAGDVVDGARLSLATEDLLVDRFRQLQAAGIRVFLSPGNHDHYRSGSPLARVRWPENVTVFRSINPESFELRDVAGNHVATVHGVGHTSPKVQENLVARITGRDEPVPQIAVVHANVVRVDLSGRHEPYAPAELSDFSNRGIDYWAIGHIHRYQELSRDPWVIYPGCTMGRDFGETEMKGCVLARVFGRHDIVAEFRPLAPVTFHHVEIDIAEMTKPAQFFDAVRSHWRSIPAESKGDEAQLVRVTARGRGEISRHLRHELANDDQRKELEDRLERSLGAIGVELFDQSMPPLDLEEIGEEISVRGEFTRLTRELMRDPARRMELLDQVHIAYPDWNGLSEEERSVYIREVLRGALVEGMERLSGETGVTP